MVRETAAPRILIVDDTPGNLKLICDAIADLGYDIFVATDGEMALKVAERSSPDVIVLDIMLPDIDGYEVCRQLKQSETTANTPVIFVTAKDRKESLARGFSVGGVDYITKPFENEEVVARVQTHLRIAQLNAQLQERNQELEAEIVRRHQAEAQRDTAEAGEQMATDRLRAMSDREERWWGTNKFIGESPTIQRILEDVARLAGAATTSVLITGESGTGKELIARAIHFGGVRAKGPFIPVNCSAVPPDLAESQFFGHARGAFTGATGAYKGYFELADRGTLFLDEIGDMPLELQVKLLRVLEDGVIRPIGATREIQMDVRIVASTNADMMGRIRAGQFRADLYFRLAHFGLAVPPLRERREDIPLLIEHFLEFFRVEMGRPRATLSPRACHTLGNYDFPGNVRELKNIIERALIACDGDLIEVRHLHLANLLTTNLAHTSSTNARLERGAVMTTRHALSQTDGDVDAAARLLGIDLSDIYSALTDEELILAYIKDRGSISNTECRQLLSVDRDRAKYLLDKMRKAGQLTRKGASRAVRYHLV